MSTPTAVLHNPTAEALVAAARVSGSTIRVGVRDGGYCIEKQTGGAWVADTEVFKTLPEVRAFALGFAGGFKRGSCK